MPAWVRSRANDIGAQQEGDFPKFLIIMGCAGQSKIQPVDTTVRTYMYIDLTDAQVELVRASWNLVQDNLLDTGLIIYDK